MEIDMMKEPDVMVYLMTGFLDSGKTQFLNFTLSQDYFQIDGKTLLILCEEGEEEYDSMEMLKYGVVIETVEDKEDLTEEWLEEMNKKHEPERVVIEYNGMWQVRLGYRAEDYNSRCEYIPDVSDKLKTTVCRDGKGSGTCAV